MKKLLPALCLVLILVLLCAIGCSQTVEEKDFLRIHIRADSNDADDQAVKLKVRDVVVNYLTPVLANVSDFDGAKKTVESHLSTLKSIAEQVLRSEGFLYGATVEIRREKFPTRTYGNVTLLAGVYDAIVFNLGTGSGDNWWCVAYPTLCFTTEQKVVYRSKIQEILDEWRKNEQNG